MYFVLILSEKKKKKIQFLKCDKSDKNPTNTFNNDVRCSDSLMKEVKLPPVYDYYRTLHLLSKGPLCLLTGIFPDR